jgi:hypothetical protein
MKMKIILCLAATVILSLSLSAGGLLTSPVAAAPTAKCVAFCQSWCASHARAQEFCNSKCTASRCG